MRGNSPPSRGTTPALRALRMSSSRILVVLIALCGAGAARPAGAEPASLQMRPGPLGDDTVYLDGRRLWRAGSGERVVAAPLRSSADDAIAFATRDRLGRLELVVVLIGGELHGHTMRWRLPAAAVAPGRPPALTWLGPQRIAVGPSLLQPALVASWRTVTGPGGVGDRNASRR